MREKKKKQRNLESTMLNERSSHAHHNLSLLPICKCRKRRSALVRQILGCQDPGKGGIRVRELFSGVKKLFYRLRVKTVARQCDYTKAIEFYA